jgi:hypothetical protein
VALVKEGEWSGQRALRVASQFANPETRTETYRGLAEQLEGEARQQCLRQALEAAYVIGDEWKRAHALADLAALLKGEPELLRQALEAATAIRNEWQRARVLAAVSRHLRGEPALLRQAFEAANAIGDKARRA